MVGLASLPPGTVKGAKNVANKVDRDLPPTGLPVEQL